MLVVYWFSSESVDASWIVDTSECREWACFCCFPGFSTESLGIFYKREFKSNHLKQLFLLTQSHSTCRHLEKCFVRKEPDMSSGMASWEVSRRRHLSMLDEPSWPLFTEIIQDSLSQYDYLADILRTEFRLSIWFPHSTNCQVRLGCDATYRWWWQCDTGSSHYPSPQMSEK